ncbi:hypothetical protein [Methylobacterium sp. WL9]|uniref:hypothetical protein n=1 Tax=Methylobacterium sp. WL9 TaxID=2603898 RepID=UPI0011C90DB8|nr:hypothetical protein [Methylobacterium sp. WL9]TXN21542.1 hypothetical protein FV217_14120 [Methylobacterium sp. WL9]
MPREQKNAAELDALLHEEVRIDGGQLDGHQWIRIVPADPETNGGANWTVMHSGEAGGFSKAIDRAQARLKMRYKLSGEA